MSDDAPDTDERTWQPPPGDADDLSEFVWAHVPCPHCDAGMMLGVQADGIEPETLDDADVTMTTIAPPEDDDG